MPQYLLLIGGAVVGSGYVQDDGSLEVRCDAFVTTLADAEKEVAGNLLLLSFQVQPGPGSDTAEEG